MEQRGKGIEQVQDMRRGLMQAAGLTAALALLGGGITSAQAAVICPQ